MKDISEIVACVVDAGTFVTLAEKIGEKTSETYYYSPFEQEYLGVERCIIGDNLTQITRMDDFLDPDILDTIDLFVFPDIGYAGLQRHLKSLGKMVWGSMGASDLELFRTKFLKVLKTVGLPIINSEKIVGVTDLGEHLKQVKNKWVKINRYRDNMETWHHIDYQHSQRELEHLSQLFGPVKENVIFVVQDDIETDVEIGYDGWIIDGQFPESSFQGYEKKNQLYLGSLMPYDKLPEGVREVNEKFAPILAEMGYRNFFATEIRVKDDVPYFIDPTPRMAGQTMEQLLETCDNLPEVILAGAQGQVLQPKFNCEFAAEATLHYTAGGENQWKTFRVPDEVSPWVKLYRYCFCDGAYQFPPHKSDEVGVVLGTGDTIEAAIDHLKENFEAMKGEPVTIDIAGFVDLLNAIKSAEDAGIEFTDQPIPESSVVLSNGD